MALPEHTFSVGETAKFFDRSIPWLRWRERDRKLFTDGAGNSIDISRTKSGYRRYTATNIKDIADALFRENKISQVEYEAVLERIGPWLPK